MFTDYLWETGELTDVHCQEPRRSPATDAEGGYGPDNPLKIQVSTRNISYYRDPAVLLIDQLKQIYIDADLDPLDTTQWYPKLMRKDYNVGLNIPKPKWTIPTPRSTRITCAGRSATTPATATGRSIG